MAKNTKQRHLEILTAAHSLLKMHGVDVSEKLDFATSLALRKELAELTGCHPNTAKRNLYKAVRQARGVLSENATENWGGDRGGGRPPKDTE